MTISKLTLALVLTSLLALLGGCGDSAVSPSISQRLGQPSEVNILEVGPNADGEPDEQSGDREFEPGDLQ